MNHSFSDILEYFGFVFTFTAISRWCYLVQLADLQHKSFWAQLCLLTLPELQWIALASLIIGMSLLPFLSFVYCMLFLFLKRN